MTITITPGLLAGTVTPPPSKSQAHRLILCAALAHGESMVSHVDLSQDILATLRCAEALGASWSLAGDTLRLAGCGDPGPFLHGGRPIPHFSCGESGSTLRFFIPVALAIAGGGIFTGQGRLLQRPLGPYLDLMAEKDISFRLAPDCLSLQGSLQPGTYRLPGHVSSQFFTGLLYGLSLLDGPSVLESTTPLESAAYVDMTVQAMGRFGVSVSVDGPGRFSIPGGQTYAPRELEVEADWSQAAFWYAACGIGNKVSVTGMAEDSLQGDRVILAYGQQLMESEADVTLDMSGCPDLLPPLAAWAALRPGVTILANAGRLRMKESDRLQSVTTVLQALGADIREEPDQLVIQGREELPGGAEVNCFGDHRIAMMAAIAATRCRESVTLRGAECVAKSYPGFWEDYCMLGGTIHEHHRT